MNQTQGFRHESDNLVLRYGVLSRPSAKRQRWSFLERLLAQCAMAGTPYIAPVAAEHRNGRQSMALRISARQHKAETGGATPAAEPVKRADNAYLVSLSSPCSIIGYAAALISIFRTTHCLAVNHKDEQLRLNLTPRRPPNACQQPAVQPPDGARDPTTCSPPNTIKTIPY